MSSVEPIDEEADTALDRGRTPQIERKPRLTNGSTTSAKASLPATINPKPTRRKKQEASKQANGTPDTNLLSPTSAYKPGFGSSYWRNLSRSPSPLGLIPIHRDFRIFIHKHEIPRKLLHVSIGFLTLALYALGVQTSSIHPILLALLIPIFTVDVIRFRWAAFNRVYIRVLGGFMRESEAHDRFNGVIMYLAGLWVTMRFCHKDVAIVSVLLLSWCDTAASTFGRLWGKYTPRIRRGKSLAGSVAAFVMGVAAAAVFWGWLAGIGEGSKTNHGENRFAFDGTLTLPLRAREFLGVDEKYASMGGALALGVVSVVSGLAASLSELCDIWGLDDNLTIPILCGAELGLFFWAFGGAQ